MNLAINSGLLKAVALVLIFLLSACGGGSGGGDVGRGGTNEASNDVTTAPVGSAGGTVSVSDPNSALSGVTVEVPAGALSSATDISIRAVPSSAPPPGLELAGPIVDFGPEGLTFVQPVTITLPGIGTFSEDRSDLIYEYAGGSWSPASGGDGHSHGQSIDRDRNTLSYSTYHFSVRGRFRDPVSESAVATARASVLSSGITTPPNITTVPFTRELENGEKRCNCPDRPSSDIQEIIVHSTNDKPGSTFAGVIHHARTVNVRQDPTQGFAHYYINRDGAIVQVAPDTIWAPHTDSVGDKRRIGIELFQPNHPTRATNFSDYPEAQLTALVLLTKDLMQRYSIPVERIRRHKDVDTATDHQDPYGWSESNWQDFLAKLRTVWRVNFEITQCDAVRPHGSGSVCNLHSGHGFHSWSRGEFWIAPGSSNNMVYRWTINDGTFDAFEPLSIPWDGAGSFRISRPNHNSEVTTVTAVLGSDGQVVEWTFPTWRIDEENVLTFNVTSVTPNSISGTFTSTGTYLRFTSHPFALQLGFMELATLRISGRWYGRPGTMPTVTGVNGLRGCGYLSVLGRTAGFNLVTRGIPEWEGNPPCSITGTDFWIGNPWAFFFVPQALSSSGN